MSNWIRKAKNEMEKKGTTGAFTSWCSDRGYGSVTDKCIQEGLDSKNITTRKRAQFAKNVQKKEAGGAVLQSILSNAGAKEGQGMKSLLEDKFMDMRGQMGGGQIKDALKDGIKGLKPSMGTIVNLGAQALAKRAENKAGAVSMADPYRNNVMERKASKRRGFGTGFKAASDSQVGQALGKVPVFGKVLQAGAGLVGGLLGGKKAEKQQEADRKESVKQLRTTQQAQLAQQASQASQFDSSGETGYADVGASITNSYLAQRRRGGKYQEGGVYQGKKLPGGKTEPLPGGALEFVGKKHSQGGIMLDAQTEVEGGETMDKVQMKKTGGAMQDYIFSDHLKLGGKTFAARHKELVEGGARQEKVQELAKMQEKKAGRTPKVMQFGGATQYQRMQEGGVSSARAQNADENLDAENASGMDAGEIMVGDQAWSDTNRQAESTDGLYGGQSQEDVSRNLERNEWFDTKDQRFGPGGFDATNEEHVTIFQKEYNKRAGSANKTQIKVDGKWGKQTTTATIPSAVPELDPKGVTKENQEVEKELIVPPTQEGEDKVVEETGGNPPVKTNNVPTLGYLGGGLQLVPPMYALKNPPAYISGPGAASVQSPDMPRVNYNAERSANANDFRGVVNAIQSNAGGPAGMVNMLAALDKKQSADRQIATAESRANKELAGEEKRMKFAASKANASLGLEASMFASKIAREQIRDRREEKLGALDSLSERLAGMGRDRMNYQATERLARAIGRDGVYDRERLYEYYLGQGMDETTALELAAKGAQQEAEVEERSTGDVRKEMRTEDRASRKATNQATRSARKQGRKAVRDARKSKRGGIFSKLNKYRRRK